MSELEENNYVLAETNGYSAGRWPDRVVQVVCWDDGRYPFGIIVNKIGKAKARSIWMSADEMLAFLEKAVQKVQERRDKKDAK